MSNKPIYDKVILKVSGEALAGDKNFGIDEETLIGIAKEIKEVSALGVKVGIVVGGGNFWRGRTNQQMDRATADYIGMLATMMNSLALQDAIEGLGLKTRVHSAVEMMEIAEPYVRRRAINQLEKGYIVIFGAGTGSPFFSTDTAAALKAAEMDADLILLAKKIDAVYSKDPELHSDAVKYTSLTHGDVLEKNLGVMDSTAASLCRDNGIKIHVFSIREKGNVMKAVCGENIGTLIT